MTCFAHRGEILHCLDNPNDGDSPDSPGSHDAYEYYADGLLVVEDGYIKKCDDAKALIGKLSKNTHIIHHQESLIIPGMVDTHIHYPQCEVIASYGAQLLDWLENYTFPVELKFHDKHTSDEMSEFFLQELLRNGTTTALVFGTVHPQSVDSFFSVAEKMNLRMICGKVMMDRNAPADLCDTPQSSFDHSQQLIDKWHGKDRLGYAVTPRFAPTSSPQQLASAGKLLKENPGVYFQTHLSENKKECEWVKQLFPDCDDYVDVYDRFNLLGRKSVFAHGIHLSDREWQRLQQSQSNLSFCPTSNLFIGSGLFNLKKAVDFAVHVGLGTDVGGGDSFSILRTINEAYKVQQLQDFNLSPIHALYLSTLGGARALDLEKNIGNFEAGKEADFIVLDYQATELIKFRMGHSKSIEDKLFALQMLGDDRAIKQTWILGEKAYSKEGGFLTNGA